MNDDPVHVRYLVTQQPKDLYTNQESENRKFEANERLDSDPKGINPNQPVRTSTPEIYGAVEQALRETFGDRLAFSLHQNAYGLFCAYVRIPFTGTVVDPELFPSPESFRQFLDTEFEASWWNNVWSGSAVVAYTGLSPDDPRLKDVEVGSPKGLDALISVGSPEKIGPVIQQGIERHRDSSDNWHRFSYENMHA